MRQSDESTCFFFPLSSFTCPPQPHMDVLPLLRAVGQVEGTSLLPPLLPSLVPSLFPLVTRTPLTGVAAAVRLSPACQTLVLLPLPPQDTSLATHRSSMSLFFLYFEPQLLVL